MKKISTNIYDFLKVAREKGFNLSTLMALCKKYPDQLNKTIELQEILEIPEFDSLENFPEPKHSEFFLEAVKEYAKNRNIELGLAESKNNNMPAKKL